MRASWVGRATLLFPQQASASDVTRDYTTVDFRRQHNVVRQERRAA